jgi:hypothetical protein
MLTRRRQVHLLDVFLLVLLCHLNLPSTGLQVNLDHFSESLLGRRERIINHVRDIILQHPRQSAMQLGVHTLQVGKRNLLLQDHLVETDDKVGIEESTVEDSETENTADEFEVVQVFRVDATVRVDLQGIVVMCRVLEQAVERIEHFVRQQEEEFSAIGAGVSKR